MAAKNSDVDLSTESATEKQRTIQRVAVVALHLGRRYVEARLDNCL